MPDFHNSLRPVFTKRIFEKLAHQFNSINIVGKKGMGRSRLLKDLEKVFEAENLDCIYIDFTKNLSYDGFKEKINQQLGKYNTTDIQYLNLPKESEGLPALYVPMGQLISPYFQGENSKDLILLFDNLDRVLSNPNQGFPKSFYNDLNSLKNKENIALCCVTEVSVTKYTIHFLDDENEYKPSDKLSWLDLSIMEMPPLERIEIRNELKRKIQGERWNEETEKEWYVTAVAKHKQPLGFLKYLADNFELQKKKSAKKHIKILETAFEKHIDSNWEKKEKKWYDKIKKWLGLAKEVSEIKKNLS